MPVANLIRQRAVRPLERLKSPLEIRKVRLRGLGGPAVCGVLCTCASATMDYRTRTSIGIICGYKSGKPRKPRWAPRPTHRTVLSGHLPSEFSWLAFSATHHRPQSAQADFASSQRRIHSLLGADGTLPNQPLHRHHSLRGRNSVSLQPRLKAATALFTRPCTGQYTSALRTPHSALRTPHSALRTPHSALRTPHSALRTPHSALRTPHSARSTSKAGPQHVGSIRATTCTRCRNRAHRPFNETRDKIAPGC
jgi:hypothetical protein